MDATWMQLETIILSDMSESERQITHNAILTQNLKYGRNEPIYERETEALTQ